MCNVSISNKATEAFEVLTGTVENVELKKYTFVSHGHQLEVPFVVLFLLLAKA